MQEQTEMQYEVVVNDEEQYSIWPNAKEIPLGWKAVGQQGNKADCLSYIKRVWTDMRPLSLRKQMENFRNVSAEEVEELPESYISPTVKFLSTGSHPVMIYPSNTTIEQLKTFLEDRFIHLNFLDTKGETCLGINIDSSSFDNTIADLEKKEKLHLEGNLVLDYVNVRCIADIDLSSFKGFGYLKIE